MIELDAARLARLRADVLAPVILITLRVGSQVYRLADADADLTIGGTTWLASSDLYGTTLPTHRSEYSRDFWELQLTEPVGTSDTWANRFISAGQRSVRLEASVAFADTEFLNLSDPLVVYTGILGALRTAADDGTVITTAQFTGPLRKVDNSAARYTSSQSQRQAATGDSTFDLSHDDSNVVRWRG